MNADQCSPQAEICLTPAAPAARLILNQLRHEGLDVVHQVLAVVRVHFQGDRLAQVQAEDTQNRLGIHHVTTRPQIHIVRITVDHVDKGLDVLSQTQLDVDGLNFLKHPLIFGTHPVYAKPSKIAREFLPNARKSFCKICLFRSDGTKGKKTDSLLHIRTPLHFLAFFHAAPQPCSKCIFPVSSGTKKRRIPRSVHRGCAARYLCLKPATPVPAPPLQEDRCPSARRAGSRQVRSR